MRQIFYSTFLVVLICTLSLFSPFKANSQEQKLTVRGTTCLEFNDAKTIVDAYVSTKKDVNQLLWEMAELNKCIEMSVTFSPEITLEDMEYYREKEGAIFFIISVASNNGISAYSVLSATIKIKKNKKNSYPECTAELCETAGLSPAVFLYTNMLGFDDQLLSISTQVFLKWMLGFGHSHYSILYVLRT